MYCIYCGELLPQDARYCRACGQLLKGTSPDEVGILLARYVCVLAAVQTAQNPGDLPTAGGVKQELANKEETWGQFFKTLGVNWGAWPRGETRRRALRLFMEVLAFDSWLALNQLAGHPEREIVLKVFYQELENTFPKQYKNLIVGEVVHSPSSPSFHRCSFMVDSLTDFIAFRCEQYEKAITSENLILDLARIMICDVPGFANPDMKLFQLGILMTAAFESHAPILRGIAWGK